MRIKIFIFLANAKMYDIDKSKDIVSMAFQSFNIFHCMLSMPHTVTLIRNPTILHTDAKQRQMMKSAHQYYQ